jgi:hypothetical protein
VGSKAAQWDAAIAAQMWGTIQENTRTRKDRNFPVTGEALQKSAPSQLIFPTMSLCPSCLSVFAKQALQLQQVRAADRAAALRVRPNLLDSEALRARFEECLAAQAFLEPEALGLGLGLAPLPEADAADEDEDADASADASAEAHADADADAFNLFPGPFGTCGAGGPRAPRAPRGGEPESMVCMCDDCTGASRADSDAGSDSDEDTTSEQ